jgi:hypothetical protein
VGAEVLLAVSAIETLLVLVAFLSKPSFGRSLQGIAVGWTSTACVALAATLVVLGAAAFPFRAHLLDRPGRV